MSRVTLVTGASGFIGARLAHALVREGWTVHLLARPDSSIAPDLAAVATVQRHDGSSAALMDLAAVIRPDVTFHLASLYLAAHAPADIAALVASNVTLTVQIAEALTACGRGHLVTTGTAWQHYAGDAAYVPVNLYAASKQAADTMLRYYVEARGLSLVTLKLFDTYGRGDTRRKLIQLLVDAARAGEVLSMSPGEQIVDLSHVDDVVDAFLACGERLAAAAAPLDETFFVSGERYRVKDLVPLVEATTGATIDVTFGGRPYRERELMVPIDPGAAGRVPHWAPKRRLADAIQDLGKP